MKIKSVAKNYIYNVIYQIIIMIIPLITTPYLSRVLGAEKIGVFSYTISITTYFILLGSLGIAMYGQREIAYVQDNKEKRTRILYEILILRLLTTILSSIIFFVVFCIKGDYIVYYRILLLELFASVIDISWYFQGLEEFKKTIFRSMIVRILAIVCIFLFVKNESDLIKYFIIYVFTTVLGNLSLWLYIPKSICKIKTSDLNIIKHLKPVIYLFIPQIAVQVYTVLDKTMLGIMILDKSEVGYYEQAQKIVKLLMVLATSIGTVMMPRIASIYAKGNKEKMFDYLYKSFSFTLMLTLPLMFGICSISDKFVPIFYGPGYDKVSILIKIISPIIVIIGLSNVIGVQYLLPTKQQKKYTISVIIGALLNFLINLLLIKNGYSIGASVATVIAECSVTISQFILVRNDFKTIKILFLSYKYIVSSIIMFIASIIIGNLIVNPYVSILFQISISVSLYFGILYFMKDNSVRMCINKIKFLVRSYK